jgi:diaminohydroxyphosphoribosylaminopyrimidine deaminase/5-amino-6-(5-phosphoribosylamino)uracil reductase
MDDAQFMGRALDLAARALFTTDPNPRVGCVLVKDGRIVGEGWHRRGGGPHAEIEALRAAGADARGATAYVSLEPCCHYGKTPPCTEALIAAGVSRVVAAMEDPNPAIAGRGLEILRQGGLRVECGLLGLEAEALNIGFCTRMRTGRPFVRSKLAMSIDGRTALASGESRWITGPAARGDVHRLRARSSVIVTGIATVLADDPALTARLDPGEPVLQPVRVVLDSRLRLPVTAKLLRQPGRTVIVTASSDARRRQALADRGAEVVMLPGDPLGRGIDLTHLVRFLGEAEFNEALVEAGAVLNGALLRAGLVDEWLVYVAPCVLGSDGRGLFELSGLGCMSSRPELRYTDVRQIGNDVRMTLVHVAASIGENQD